MEVGGELLEVASAGTESCDRGDSLVDRVLLGARSAERESTWPAACGGIRHPCRCLASLECGHRRGGRINGPGGPIRGEPDDGNR